jgi:2-C-methyl-D-erythritol 4-phosphate cytidylyltransferase
MDAKLMIETNFSFEDVEGFKDLLAKYMATRIVKEIIIAVNEENTNASLSNYHALISTEIYSVLCKKFKSKKVMQSLKNVDSQIVAFADDVIKAYANEIFTNLQRFAEIVVSNKEFKEYAFESFFETLNKNIGGEKNGRTDEIVRQLEKVR